MELLFIIVSICLSRILFKNSSLIFVYKNIDFNNTIQEEAFYIIYFTFVIIVCLLIFEKTQIF